MARFNMLTAFENLSIPKELHGNAYRLLMYLDDASPNLNNPNVYNPDAASIIRDILEKASRHSQNSQLTVAFIGLYESLLLSLQTDFNEYTYLKYIENYTLHNNIGADIHTQIPKIELDEKIGYFLYGSRPRNIVPIENYYPSVNLSQMGAKLMIVAAVKRYFSTTPDAAVRSGKIRYLERESQKNSLSEADRFLCEVLAHIMKSYKDDPDDEGGESFARILKERFPDDKDSAIIKQCIKARNAAVHEGKCICDLHTLGFLLTVLFMSPVAMESEREDQQMQETIEAEMKKDIQDRKESPIFTTIIPCVVLAALLYFICLFVTGIFIGKPEIEKVQFTRYDPQFDARINEVIATKDTTTLLQIQEDVKWINDHLIK